MNSRFLTRSALIAALYVVLCLVFSSISFGSVQIRVSEALTLLAVFCPEAVIGVTLGCFLSNMIASAPVDMVVGTTATLLAALCTRKLRGRRIKKLGNLPIAASIPPVLFNALIVGVELTLLYSPGAPLPVYLANMASVGLGQIISCCGLGLLLVWGIEKKPALLRLFQTPAT